MAGPPEDTAPVPGALGRDTLPDTALAETLSGEDASGEWSRRGGPGLARGDKLDRFTVLDLLGQGGMGAVVSAYDPDLDRKVAIKLLRSEDRRDASATHGQQRLLREAQAMARLSHPNVVTVYEVGTVEDRVFVAMEFIDGQTLRA